MYEYVHRYVQIKTIILSWIGVRLLETKTPTQRGFVPSRGAGFESGLCRLMTKMIVGAYYRMYLPQTEAKF